VRERLWDALSGRPGYFLPHVHGDRVPPVAAADDALLPARSVIATPLGQYGILVEIEAIAIVGAEKEFAVGEAG